MRPFLKELAEILTRELGNDLQHSCLVFPNRRAALFFSEYYKELLDKPAWSPLMLTISGLMSELSDLKQVSDLEAIFHLHEIYQKHSGEKESFDKFYYWGDLLLRDFNDIDKYLVDPHQLFFNLSALKEIEDHFSYLEEEQLKAIRTFWKAFDLEKMPGHQKTFIRVWQILEGVYKELNNKLREKNTGYEGMIYRDVAQKIGDNRIRETEYHRVIFVGFNALNQCEKKLLNYFKNKGRALFYWDYDSYYTGQQDHEAGRFIRDNIRDYPATGNTPLSGILQEQKPGLRIITAPSDVGQTKLLPGILEGITAEQEDHSIAIVLADEQLLMPALHSIPPEYGNINVTMGYPLLMTPAYSLAERLVRLYRNRRGEADRYSFYYKDVQGIFQHPYIRSIIDHGADDLLKRIVLENRIQVPGSELRVHPLSEILFPIPGQVKQIPRWMVRVLLKVFSFLGENGDNASGLDREFLYRMVQILQKLGEMLQQYDPELETATLMTLLRRMLQPVRIPFEGEPLEKIQVLGILETRLLDFDHVILLGMNEENMPGMIHGQSMIPYNLRKGFGLPVTEDHDSIYAYYFYRLLHRSRSVNMIYNNTASGNRTGEASRFLLQLDYDDKFEVDHATMRLDVTEERIPVIRIPKTERIMQVLDSYREQKGKYLSPSALNAYLDCSLKFYFRYIARISEQEEIKEEVDAAVFGSILHRTIAALYGNTGKTVLQKEDLEALIGNRDRIRDALGGSFREVYSGEFGVSVDISGGKTALNFEILENFLLQIIRRDLDQVPIHVLGLEKKVKRPVQVQVGERTCRVMLGGTIDRIDRTRGTTRIIDYKTGGRARLGFSGLDSLFQRSVDSRNREAFQAMLYSWIWMQLGHGAPLIPGLYIMRDIFRDDFSYAFRTRQKELLDFTPLAAEFKSGLDELMTEIFNPDSGFGQTGNQKICSFCPYKSICHREQS